MRDSGAVEKPHPRVGPKPDAEKAVRNSRSCVTCIGVILPALLMEREKALFQQPHSHLLESEETVTQREALPAQRLLKG